MCENYLSTAPVLSIWFIPLLRHSMLLLLFLMSIVFALVFLGLHFDFALRTPSARIKHYLED